MCNLYSLKARRERLDLPPAKREENALIAYGLRQYSLR
jgi:hypothetical protein